MYNKFIVNKYSLISDGVWSSTPETITDIYDVQVTQSIGDNKDIFGFKLNNPRNTNNWTFKPVDKVNIYFGINGESASDSNLIMVGLVKNIQEDAKDRSKVLRIEGVGYSDIVTSALVFYDPGDATVNVTQYLQGCLESVKLRNKGFDITWSSTNPSISATLSTSTSKVRDYDKSFSSLLDKYLKSAYTGTDDYYWYVNNSNELVIGKRNSGTSKGTLTEGVDFETIKTKIKTDDVKNFIIVKCGYDLNNNPITTRYDDIASRAKYGFRYYMLVDRQIAEKIKTNNPGYDNDAVIEAAKAEGYAQGEAYAKLHNRGYLMLDIIMSPSVSYSVGDRVQVLIPSYPDFTKNSTSTPSYLYNKVLRIESIQYDINGVLLTLSEESVV